MKILYLHCHDMGRYNQIYGYGIPTPNLFAAAGDAVVFRNAHCACPTCSPSRGAMLTGRYPHCNGLIGLTHRGFALNHPEQHLAAFLRSQGYLTALAGIQHETNGDPHGLGYEITLAQDYPDNGMEHDEITARAAAEFLAAHRDTRDLFLSVGFLYPHRTYKKHTTVNPDFVRVPECVPDTPRTREDFADYIQSVNTMDHWAGVVLDALKENGIYDETLLLLTTDHGIAFPFMKCNLYESGTGVTLAFKLPHAHSGRVSDVLCSHVDVFPTICDLLGLEKPSYLQGVSLLPVLQGQEVQVRDAVFAEVTYHAAYEPVRMIRTKNYLLIKRYDPEMHRIVLPNIDDGITKRYEMENGLTEMVTQENELYQLDLDPAQRNNRYHDPAFREIREQLETQLLNFQRDTGDPILAGYVPKPAGARINVKTGVHPGEQVYEA